MSQPLIALTGATGFIGRHLLRELLLLDRRADEARSSATSPGRRT